MSTEKTQEKKREILRCDHCSLVQFRTANDLCRRCRKSLYEAPSSPESAASVPVDTEKSERSRLAIVVRDLRHVSNLSQQKLAARMVVPRSYISKVERGEVAMTAAFLERLATALEVDISVLLNRGAPQQPEIIALISADPFFAELAKYAPKLDSLQRSIFLNHVREIASGRRRTSYPSD